MKPTYTNASTIAAMCLENVEDPDRTALIFEDKRLSYRQLDEAVHTVARGLLGLGLDRGDKLGTLLPNIIEHPVIQLGASLVGIVIVPLNARYRATELAHVIANSEIVGLISTREIDQVDFAGRLQAAFPGLVAGGDPQRLSIAGAPRLRWIMMLGSAAVEDIYLSSEDLAAAGSAVPPEAVVEQSKMLSARDTWALMYTSGTTSLPKACLLTHESVVRNWRVCSRRMGIQSGDVFFDPLPFYHMSGPGPMLLALEANGTFVSMLHFDPARALETIERNRPTVLWPGVPTVALPLVKHPRFSPSLLATVRSAYCIGPRETLELVQSSLPNGRLMTSYGMTESGGAITWSDVTEPADLRLGTNGSVCDGLEICIKPPDGQTIETEDGQQIGEICYRGPLLFSGYYRDPDGTAQAIDADGWMHSGDYGHLAADGRLHYRGRIKDMLKVGGENVAALEIESILTRHPAVRLAAVVAEADDRYGEVPVAYVELVDGLDVPTDELTELCRAELASFKVPRRIYFVEEWPAAPNTKIQKNKLNPSLAVYRPQPSPEA